MSDGIGGTKLASSTMPNAMGSVDIFDGDMDMEGFTSPNVFGGEDFVSFGNGEDMMSFDDPLAHSAEFRMDPLVF